MLAVDPARGSPADWTWAPPPAAYLPKQPPLSQSRNDYVITWAAYTTFDDARQCTQGDFRRFRLCHHL